MRAPLALFVLALIAHGLWALTLPSPVDWDPAYYRSVARALASGRGAISGAAWNLVAPPDLPQPADLHWMPLPSRVIAPGVWIWWARGDQLVTALLGALWAPLAWGLGRSLGADARAAALGGLLAAAGGAYARFLSTPDSIALYGVLGGLVWTSVAGQRSGPAALWSAAAALCRGDGFLIGACAALGLRGRARVGVAASGAAAFAAWSLRSLWVGGADWRAQREAAAGALEMSQILLGEVAPADLGARLVWLVGEAPDMARTAALSGVGVLLPLALAGAWGLRRRPVVQAAGAYALAMPLVTHLAAPAIASSGTLFRSGAALFPLGCALAAIAATTLGDRAAAARGYPRWFIPGLVGLGVWIGSAGVGIGTWRARPPSAVGCDGLTTAGEDEVIFAGDPLLAEARCGVRAVVLPRGLSPERAAALAERYGIRRALAAPTGLGGGLGAEPADVPAILPGWSRAGDRIWMR